MRAYTADASGVVTNVVIVDSIADAVKLFAEASYIAEAKDAKIGNQRPVKVLVSYFPGWKNPPEQIVTWYGIDVWSYGKMTSYPERVPIEGKYNEDTQEVVDKNLAWLAQAGVDGVGVDWYRDDYLNHGITRILRSTAEPGVKAFIMYANDYTEPTNDQRGYLFEAFRRAVKYFASPRYMRVDGLPIFVLLSTDNLDRCIRASLSVGDGYSPTMQDREELLASCNRVVANVLAGDNSGGISGASVNAKVSGENSTKQVYLAVFSYAPDDWRAVSYVDGSTYFNISGSNSYTNLDTYAQSLWASAYQSLMAVAPNKTMWVTCMAGWDKRAWGGSVNPVHDNCLPTTQEFINHLSAAKTFALANRNTDATVWLYAFNEFGEGGWIAPTIGIGQTKINAVRETFGWAKC